MKYERLTERDEFNNADIIGLATEKLFGELCFDETNLLTTALNRLAELEDKIENGMLVELPRIIHPNKAEWHVQYQYPSGVIQYDVCFTQAEAEAKLKKEMQNEKLN